jgi:flagellin FlaB
MNAWARRKKMRTLRKSKKGMTGIETAIIVIAFVIAASVFAFAILNMGLLTTGKATQAVDTGIGQAQSSMKISTVYAFQDPNNSSQATGIALVVQPSGTGATDFNEGKISIALTTATATYANVYTSDNFINSTIFDNTYSASFTNYLNGANNTGCSIIELQGNGQQLLSQGAQFAVFLNLNSSGLNTPLVPYEQFSVEIVPASGAELTFSAYMPSALTPTMILTGS